MNLENYFYYFCYYGEELSYNNICYITGEDKKNSAHSKSAQIKRWRRIVILEKIKSKYRFIRMLNEKEIEENKRKERETKLRLSDNYKQSCIDNFNQLNLSLENMHKAGVYKICLGNKIYIGQTNNFYLRFSQHKFNYNHCEEKTKELLDQGATFDVIEYEEDKTERLKLERKWIKYYAHNPDYDCINTVCVKNMKRKNLKYAKLKVSRKDLEEIEKLLKEKGVEYCEI